jgi:two-component system response regulator VicR
MAQNRPKKILIIDDEKSFCEVISYTLQKSGFEINCYNDPKEALLNINDNLPDLILLDILMPEIDGLELLVNLKKDLGEKCPPIILLTNLQYTKDGRKIDEDFAFSIGANGIIYKSNNLDEVINKISNLFSDHQINFNNNNQ